METLGDLAPGMLLEGVVTNVAAFGAFVDIGVHQDGLVHISALSHNFVNDPREVVKPGDVVRVKVLDVDIPRKRISLTLRLDDEIPTAGADSGAPGAQRGAPGRPGGQGRGGPSRGGQGGQRTGGQAQGGQRSGGQPGQRTGGQPRGGQRGNQPANTALAEALRKAGLTP